MNGELEISVMIGVSGSGKSTYCNKTLSKNGCEVVSTDMFVDKFAEMFHLDYQKAMEIILEHGLMRSITKQFYDRIEYCIEHGKSFAIDRTNLTSGARKHLLGSLDEMCAKHDIQDVVVTGVVVRPDEFELKMRNEKRLKETGKQIPPEILAKQIDDFEYPTVEEGFHRILDVVKSEITERP